MAGVNCTQYRSGQRGTKKGAIIIEHIWQVVLENVGRGVGAGWVGLYVLGWVGAGQTGYRSAHELVTALVTSSSIIQCV